MEFFPITLLRTEEVADRTQAFFFSKPDGFTFLAGQYAMLRIPPDRLVEPDVRSGMRPLSIASAPSEAELVFVMREGMTGFKKTMWDLKSGEEISVSSPLGNATIPEGDVRPVVILSGGVGIAPARSMLLEAVSKNDPRKYVLFSSNRFMKDIPFQDLLKTVKLPDFTYIFTLSAESAPATLTGEERGRISAEIIERYLPEWREALYYVIGAPAFADAMRELLLGIGIASENIHIDPFAGLTSGAAQVPKVA
ncbi:MAG: FAD-dependent oxidoreductase [Candidatus Moranbacteria bacterium]|nr:FAD-dependent oxidoreductase [Candidatus Moranbacteria bacterium]